MADDSPHCEECGTMMFGGMVVGDPRYFCGVCGACFKKLGAERDAAIELRELDRRIAATAANELADALANVRDLRAALARADAAFARRTIERDRARAEVVALLREAGINRWAHRRSGVALADDPPEVEPAKPWRAEWSVDGGESWEVISEHATEAGAVHAAFVAEERREAPGALCRVVFHDDSATVSLTIRKRG